MLISDSWKYLFHMHILNVANLNVCMYVTKSSVMHISWLVLQFLVKMGNYFELLFYHFADILHNMYVK